MRTGLGSNAGFRDDIEELSGSTKADNWPPEEPSLRLELNFMTVNGCKGLI